MDLKIESLEIHKKLQGKLRVELTEQLTEENLSLLYSPGVAYPCLEIAEDESKLNDYTWVNQTVAIISDGSAVLGLGNIGPKASMPVMEGKAALLRQFSGLNSVPIVLDEQDPEKIIATIQNIAPSFGAINLEDISAPNCVIIERALEESLDIPIFHDDQHGTAIVTLAAIINSLKVVKKEVKDCKVVISGAGSAGNAILRLLVAYGFSNILVYDINGLITYDNADDFLKKEIANLSKQTENISFRDSFVDADIFIGVSAGNIVFPEDIKKMSENPIVFAMANPTPEIDHKLAIEAGVAVMGSGRSDYPNQVNNVLAFPGLFKGLLQGGKKRVTQEMKLNVARAIANIIDESDLRSDYIIPSPFDERLVEAVANAVIATNN